MTRVLKTVPAKQIGVERANTPALFFGFSTSRQEGRPHICIVRGPVVVFSFSKLLFVLFLFFDMKKNMIIICTRAEDF